MDRQRSETYIGPMRNVDFSSIRGAIGCIIFQIKPGVGEFDSCVVGSVQTIRVTGYNDW